MRAVRRIGLAVVAAVLVAASAVAVGGAVVWWAGSWGERDAGADRSAVDTAPTPERVAAALRFAALADLPPGSEVVALRAEQGIDGLVELRVSMPPDQLAGWAAAGGLPPAAASTVPVDAVLGPDLPPGTPVVPRHRAGRVGGGVVVREGIVVAPDLVEIRAFET